MIGSVRYWRSFFMDHTSTLDVGASKSHIALTILAVVFALLAIPAPASAESSWSVTQGDVMLFPGAFEPFVAEESDAGVIFDADENVVWNIPGSRYQPGSGWWALICDVDEGIPGRRLACNLRATSLVVAKSRISVGDDKFVASQQLRWLPSRPRQSTPLHSDSEHPERLLIVFKPVRLQPGLALSEGEVPTYLHKAQRDDYPKTGRPGSTEVRIPIGDGRHADIVPRVRKTSLSGSGDVHANVPDVLELRIGDRRQRLSGRWSGCSATGWARHAGDYLWWAGDLDRDGKLDFVLSRDAANDVELYLSSSAGAGELVGMAGRFKLFSPGQDEC